MKWSSIIQCVLWQMRSLNVSYILLDVLETFPRMSIQAHMQSNCHEHVNLLKTGIRRSVVEDCSIAK